jgi:hypothetical protein
VRAALACRAPREHSVELRGIELIRDYATTPNLTDYFEIRLATPGRGGIGGEKWQTPADCVNGCVNHKIGKYGILHIKSDSSVGTCLHELGHMFGLAHEQDRADMIKASYTTTDLMTTCIVADLTRKASARINIIYTKDPDLNLDNALWDVRDENRTVGGRRQRSHHDQLACRSEHG